ncbi:quinoprotein dehydrogenase-associated SoxYZ-like carrier [Pseudomonas fontis]|uniref:Quinoprotein dehydrogenase-associated SoxYZ-like carrier n=1 Tax=Pseudomonas fontis TaxID=2942633 RepID=A0ABT5NKL4_9PSED|nr:quinoprotein dehydrogenase-associated SoxYZ-like carrier [Pseudomonas fontis]MDD0976165.1 quinoprotein dehydrogenase-associated SoxYZ-like carrier [Pseudomonas fontis]MDD0989072.1 quinoprotein dehydrogenase-associated SoxYZ-like carrier [Pseudomonas fontis]
MGRVPLLLAMLLCAPAFAVDPGPDPVPSVMWEFYRQQWLMDAPYQFDARVRVIAPPFAEDARQVPLQVDARALPGTVQRILVWAELNPLPKIVDFQPGPQVLPWLAVRIRIEQATALRAAVLTDDGIWHVGSTLIDAAGGGCTAPSVVRSEAGWEERLGQVLGARFPREDFSRLRLEVSHPMDNGLVGGVPEFYIEHAELRDAQGQVLATLELFPAVSENPNLSFDLRRAEALRLSLRDNNGNTFDAAID